MGERQRRIKAGSAWKNTIWSDSGENEFRRKKPVRMNRQNPVRHFLERLRKKWTSHGGDAEIKSLLFG
jgi:hypothetical protein